MSDIKEIIGVNKRWEDGVEHNQKSIDIFNFLRAYDFKFCGDYFNWKSGGDGDNGELLMYQLDEFFDSDIYKQYEEEIRKQVIEELEDWIEDHYGWGTMALEPLEVGKNFDYDKDTVNDLEPYSHLFQFIKLIDTEPYNIEELLKEKL